MSSKYVIYLDGYFLTNNCVDGWYWSDVKKDAARFDRETAERMVFYYPGATLVQVH